MPKEWDESSKYNSFNSWKGLTYYEQYKKIVRAMESNAPFPTPIEVSFDLSHVCQLNCRFCNSSRYLRDDETISIDQKYMSEGHAISLTKFLLDWGVRGICIGGGGESTLNPVSKIIPRIVKYSGKSAHTAFITNGVAMDDEFKNVVVECCQWIGISVDAGSEETYSRIKGVSPSVFTKVLDNIRRLVGLTDSMDSSLEITYKYLLHPDNIGDVYNACKLAKDLGVWGFHARPADVPSGAVLIDTDKAKELLGKCHELETSEFRVFTVYHKFDERMRTTHKFKRCLAAPLLIQVCCDGKVYLCVDHRIKERFCLGTHYPDPRNILNIWGSDVHKDMMRSVVPDKDCGRCTFGPYNEQIQNMILRDSMCVDFT